MKYRRLFSHDAAGKKSFKRQRSIQASKHMFELNSPTPMTPRKYIQEGRMVIRQKNTAVISM
jgi:hypothetical protein